MTSTPIRRAPCSSCPYARSTPPGVWAAEEYEKLRRYDGDMWTQPQGLFLCHHSALGESEAVCRGWVAVHGWVLLALRLAAVSGDIDPAEVDVPLPAGVEVYASGGEAADAGSAAVDDPDAAALAAINRLTAARHRARRAHGG